MKSIVLAAIAFLLVLGGPARAGNEVGGGGIAENGILYAFFNLEKFIDLALGARGSALTADERALLEKIRAALPRERENKEAIAFRSERKEPGFFQVEGQIRIAKTGYAVGETIYINVDLLYPRSLIHAPIVLPPERPYDVSQAVSLLVHELGHHQGVRDHTSLDLLGAKVQTVARVRAQETDGGPQRRYLIATAFDYGPRAATELILRDNEKVLDFTDRVTPLLACPAGKMVGYQLWNLHWLRPRGDRFALRARVQINCGSPMRPQPRDAEIEIAFTMPPGGRIDLKSTEVRRIE